MGLNEGMVRRVEEIYRETRNVVKVNGEQTKEFWTTRGVRQGCPLSSTLFSLYIADVEETLKRGQEGGVVVGREKIWSSAYADDIVVLAKSADELKNIMKRLERYLRKKNLNLNIEKSKVMVFSKGGRRKKEVWEWEGKEVQEARVFKYFGHTFSKNNGETEQIKENAKRANVAMAQVWSLGERLFGESFKRRMRMFDSMVKSIVMYATEIWGWKEYKMLEGIQVKYVKWVLGLERCTPNYIVLEESKRDSLRIEAGKRALRFEDRIWNGESSELLTQCWEEKRKAETKKELAKREKERTEYLHRNGLSSPELERRRNEGEETWKIATERDREVQGQGQYNKIQTAKYDKRYKEIRTAETPRYLKKDGKKGNQKLIASFRCGNGERENRYWEDEEMRICRSCGKEQETMEHMVRYCEKIERREERISDILGDDGRGIAWMRRVVEERKRREQEREARNREAAGENREEG